MFKVLKSFEYAHDGIHNEFMAEGTVREFRPELVDGLKSEGWIADDDGVAFVPTTIIEPPPPAAPPAKAPAAEDEAQTAGDDKPAE